MEGLHEKNAFYVVRKGDLVGVYKNLNDCLSVAGSSGNSPPVTVYKGYNLQGQTEDCLKSHGLKNALYCIDAASFDRINASQLFPYLPQQPIPTRETNSGYSSSSRIKRPADVHWQEVDVNGLAITSSLNHSSKHVKLDGSFPSQAISPGCRSCTLEFDGAAKRNPGPAGAGAILRSEDGSVAFRLREGVGTATNNAAEYRALILGLNFALEKGYQQIQVRGDSMLVCMQLQGLWKTKSENMAKFCKIAKELKDKFVSFQINHVLREFNSEADAQANKAISLKAPTLYLLPLGCLRERTIELPESGDDRNPNSAMVLEATMICIDNSEWTRNGDYAPNRFQAQADAVNLICGAKTQSNPENTVGVMTMAGKGVRVLVTPTSDLGKILACMHGLEIGGEMNLAAAIQVAQLALKHRQNKKQQQRIIVFAGSPIKHDKKQLEMIGRKLKKNSVALDIVDYGEEDDGKPEKLEALLAAVNNNDTSHIVHVPSGPNALSDVLISTPVFTGDGEGGSGFAAAAAAAAAGGVSGFDLGVDPNLDPELALALRVSMEEERARQEAAAKKAAEEAAKQEKGGEQTSSQDATMTEGASASASGVDDKKEDLMDDENALLQRALAMSMDDTTSSHHGQRDTEMSDAAADDPDLALALQLSVQEGGKDSSSQTEMTKLLADQSFVSSILASLPGVDPNDPSVKELLASMQNQAEKKEEPKEPKEEDKK